MLNLPIELAAVDAAPLPLTIPEVLPAAAATSPAVTGFAVMLAAQEPGADGGEPAAGGTENPYEAAPETPAIDQPWALILVPELANLPAPMPPLRQAPAPIAAGDAGAADAASLWPPRATVGPRLRLAGLPPADSQRPRGWQNALPSAPRAVPGQIMAHPAAQMPLRSDRPTAAPGLVPTNPLPLLAGAAPALPPGLDAANLPPPWMVPMAAAPVATPAAPVAMPAAPVATPAAPVAMPPFPAAMLVVPPQPSIDFAAMPAVLHPRAVATALPLVAEAPPPPEPILLPDRADAPLAPVMPPAALTPAPASRAPTQSAGAAPAATAPAAAPSAEPAMSIASDRLGDVAVRLSGGPDQLQVSVQAQPAAAALIGADAPRLLQELAAAGIALAGLSVNGQRADLAGGQRERQRQPGRRGDDGAPLAGVRRLNAASAAAARMTANPTLDRFA